MWPSIEILGKIPSCASCEQCCVSAEGFQSWMWRGLTFLLPFLFFGHVSKYNLYHFDTQYESCGKGASRTFTRQLCEEGKESSACSTKNKISSDKWIGAALLLKMCPLTLQFWQLYNSVTLFRLAGLEDCKEWQVRNSAASNFCVAMTNL